MRNLICKSLCLIALCTLALGCRQTAGPLTGGPLAPTNGLAPVTGQSPALSPFGGTTRVTPPATGSYTAPNNYLGGTIGQANTGVSPAGGFVGDSFTNPNNSVIGSGVQVAGWNDATVGGGATGSATDFGVNSATRDPRSGGMRTIDLTGAPAPPGYRQPQPIQQTFQQQQPFQQQQFQQPQQQFQHPQFQQPAQPQFQPRPQFNQPMLQTGVRTITAPNAGQIAELPGTNPSSSSTSQDNLGWRTPRTQF